VLAVGIVVSLSLGFALLLNERFRGSSVMQVLILLPWAIPLVVSGTLWKWIFDANFGLANEVLLRLGMISSYQPFVVQQWPAMLMLLLAYVWVETPLPTLLFFASLQSVPQELYEQAKIDGASAWHRFKTVTFKWITPIFFIVLVYETLMDIRAFDLVYVVTAGGPADFTALISFFTYRQAFVYLDFGRATALSLTLVAISVLLIFLYYRLLRVGRLRLRIR
jgi:ABC-type sugar transport system permease subunit